MAKDDNNDDDDDNGDNDNQNGDNDNDDDDGEEEDKLCRYYDVMITSIVSMQLKTCSAMYTRFTRRKSIRRRRVDLILECHQGALVPLFADCMK